MKHSLGGRGKHTTVIDSAYPLIRSLKEIPNIEVSNGRITSGLSAGKQRVIVKSLSGGLELIYRGPGILQRFIVYGGQSHCVGEIARLAREYGVDFVDKLQH